MGAGWLRHRAQAGDPRPDWSHIDLKLGAVELAADEDGRKPGGSWRVVPLVKPLAKRLREQWIAQGRPTTGKVCPPRRYSPSAMLDLGYIQERVHRECRQQGMEPIGRHKSPHTAATWLDMPASRRSAKNAGTRLGLTLASGADETREHQGDQRGLLDAPDDAAASALGRPRFVPPRYSRPLEPITRNARIGGTMAPTAPSC